MFKDLKKDHRLETTMDEAMEILLGEGVLSTKKEGNWSVGSPHVNPVDTYGDPYYFTSKHHAQGYVNAFQPGNRVIQENSFRRRKEIIFFAVFLGLLCLCTACAQLAEVPANYQSQEPSLTMIGMLFINLITFLIGISKLLI